MGSKPPKELGPGKIGLHVPHGMMFTGGGMLGRNHMCVRSTHSHDEEVRESCDIPKETMIGRRDGYAEIDVPLSEMMRVNDSV